VRGVIMIAKTILLDDVKKVTNFVNETFKFKGDIAVKHGKYIVNGRSLLGLMSLDLSQPLICEIEEREEQIWNVNCKGFEYER
jgi:phosphotransferase system HPr-like phosphotransfer protein